MNIFSPKEVGEAITGIYQGWCGFDFAEGETMLPVVADKTTGELIGLPSWHGFISTMYQNLDHLKEGETEIMLTWHGKIDIGGGKTMNNATVLLDGKKIADREVRVGLDVKEKLAAQLARRK